MYKDKTVCVVVPAYNEEKLISRVIETMPDYVDNIVVVDDRSADRTTEIVRGYREGQGERIIRIEQEENQGVGGAITTGYKWARDNKIAVTAVMAGDAQMAPEDLPNLLEPVVTGQLDYAKGNRLFTGNAWQLIPKVRYLGNSYLSLLTKIASGYWHVADSQCGYAAITSSSLKKINLDKIYRRYGVPNDILVHLNVINARVMDVPIRPIYNIGEKSGIRLRKVIPTLSFLLLRRFFWRLKEKYVIRDFHPLVFFYAIGLLLFFPGLYLGTSLAFIRITQGPVVVTSSLFAAFLTISGIQFLLFAMWFDMEHNRILK